MLRACQAMSTPTDLISSTSVSVSRMRGTFCSVTGWSVNSAAAMIGNAEFLLPAGWMVPASRRPPSTMYWIGAITIPSASVRQHDATNHTSCAQCVDPFLRLAHRLFLHRHRLHLAGARQRHQFLPLREGSGHEALDGHALVDPLHHR